MATFKLFANPAPEGTGEEGLGAELGVEFKVTEAATLKSFHVYIPTGKKPTFYLVWEKTSTEKGTLLRKQAGVTTGTNAWVEITLTTPLALVTGKSYIVAFYSAVGAYAHTKNIFLSAAITSGPLYAFKDTEVDTLGGGAQARNGCFIFDSERGGLGAGGGKAEGGTEGLCPKTSFNATNYFMDVVVETGGGETIYTDARSGAITCLGAGKDAAVQIDKGSGAMTESGTKIEAYGGTDKGSGAMTEAGSGKDLYGGSESRAGSIESKGSGKDLWGGADTRSGSMGASGAGSGIQGYIDVRTGTVIVTGTSTEAHEQPDHGLGQITVIGISQEKAVRTDTGTGSIILQGSGVESLTFANSRSGAAVLAGSGTDGASRASSPSGSIVLAGTKTEHWDGPSGQGSYTGFPLEGTYSGPGSDGYSGLGSGSYNG